MYGAACCIDRSPRPAFRGRCAQHTQHHSLSPYFCLLEKVLILSLFPRKRYSIIPYIQQQKEDPMTQHTYQLHGKNLRNIQPINQPLLMFKILLLPPQPPRGGQNTDVPSLSHSGASKSSQQQKSSPQHLPNAAPIDRVRSVPT